MSYFLKKTKKKKGVYLQIYDGTYDPQKGYAVQRSVRAIGYVHELIQEGIKDPIAYYRSEVDRLNQERIQVLEKDKEKKIGNETPEKFIGYFPLKSINDSLGVKGHMDLLQLPYAFKCSAYEVLASLIYARVVEPCSKHKTYYDVLPGLFEKINFSEGQMYDVVEFLGWEYEKIIEIYNNFVNKKFGYNTSSTYFDCTNFYFEIDSQDSLRRNGPSKDGRRDPIVGMGVLLDMNQIPLGMKIFPGNESEKPRLQEVLSSLKKAQSIKGKTICVADKGLNSANNIYTTLKEGNGYIFSKSVKMLPDTEKTWVLIENDYKDVLDKDNKLLYKIKECVDDFPYEINRGNGRKEKITLTEKRIVTFSPNLAVKKRAEIRKQVEKAKNLRLSEAKKSEYGYCAKFVTFKSTDEKGKETSKKVSVSINEDAIKEALALAGYNMIVTSEIQLSADYVRSTYRNLWRIEESFRVMKSYLDARPVFLQKRPSIKGHFLICYLSVLLLRLFQFKILNEKYSSEDLINFMTTARVVKQSPNKYINITKSSDFITDLSVKTGLAIDHYYLSNGQIKDMLNYRFKRS